MTINRIEVVIRNYRILHKNLVGTKKGRTFAEQNGEFILKGKRSGSHLLHQSGEGEEDSNTQIANIAIVLLSLYFYNPVSTRFHSMQHFRRKQIQKAQNKSFPLCLASFTSFVRVLLAHFFMDESFSV